MMTETAENSRKFQLSSYFFSNVLYDLGYFKKFKTTSLPTLFYPTT